jgi:GNAT superfamily N-acetyltransferase
MSTELRRIPGVGERAASRLEELGYTTIASLKGQDPEEIYNRDCLLEGAPVDRRQLYVYRCAVYFASTEHPDPEKLKWWNWKDQPQPVSFIPAVQKSQLQTISRLADIIWHEHYRGILSDEQIDYMVKNFQSFDAMCEQRKNEGYQYFLIRLEEDVGYMALKLEENRIFLSKLYLSRQARGQGLASRAIAYIEDMCRENGLGGIWLTVNRYNQDSIAVYEHLGFRRAYESKTDIGGGFFMDDYIMEKEVS